MNDSKRVPIRRQHGGIQQTRPFAASRIWQLYLLANAIYALIAIGEALPRHANHKLMSKTDPKSQKDSIDEMYRGWAYLVSPIGSSAKNYCHIPYSLPGEHGVMKANCYPLESIESESGDCGCQRISRTIPNCELPIHHIAQISSGMGARSRSDDDEEEGQEVDRTPPLGCANVCNMPVLEVWPYLSSYDWARECRFVQPL